MSVNLELLQSEAEKFGIELSKNQLERFSLYAQILVEWNKKVNLTAITEPDKIAMLHFADSLSLLYALEIPQNATVIDVGTGAGFPGVPVKILRDDINLTLLDSLNKRLDFLKELSAVLLQKNVFVHSRAEDAGAKTEHREKYDIAAARAVAPLNSLCEYCLPFVKPSGYFAAMKGSNYLEETELAQNAIELLGGQVEKTVPLTLADGSKRGIVIIKKISQTSTKYPRTAAKMTKKPL